MKVSVCIPTYNTGKFIGETIESVLRQTFSDYELVVCDNLSTDETEEICRAVSDSRFKYVRFDEFVGQAANWNRALEQATGEFVILLHSDDILEADFLQQAVSMLEDNKDVGLVHCSVTHIDETGKTLTHQRLFEHDLIDRDEQHLKKFLFEGCVINPVGVLVRRAVYLDVGNFTDKIVWGVDPHMWTRIALKFPIGYLSEPLAKYRVHSNSGTSGVMKSGRYATDEVWMMEDVFRHIPPNRTDLHSEFKRVLNRVAHRTWCHAEDLCSRGDNKSARLGIRRALEIAPAMIFEKRVWALWLATFFGYHFFSRLRGVLGSERGV